MDDAGFLSGYDGTTYDRPSVAVDLVLLSVVGDALSVVLIRRDAPPQQGRWALPGGFVGISESLDAAARRVLADKAGLERIQVEQLYTFGEPDRDPRMRIVSVAYVALLPADRLAASTASDLMLARLETGCGTVEARSDKGETLQLAFDHAAILAVAVQRLRGRLHYTPIAVSLLPERFTLRELQQVHEAILGRTLNKPAFRRRLLDTGWIEATGERAAGTSYRPPELYRFRQPEEPSCP